MYHILKADFVCLFWINFWNALQFSVRQTFQFSAVLAGVTVMANCCLWCFPESARALSVTLAEAAFVHFLVTKHSSTIVSDQFTVGQKSTEGTQQQKEARVHKCERKQMHASTYIPVHTYHLNIFIFTSTQRVSSACKSICLETIVKTETQEHPDCNLENSLRWLSPPPLSTDWNPLKQIRLFLFCYWVITKLRCQFCFPFFPARCWNLSSSYLFSKKGFSFFTSFLGHFRISFEFLLAVFFDFTLLFSGGLGHDVLSSTSSAPFCSFPSCPSFLIQKSPVGRVTLEQLSQAFI